MNKKRELLMTAGKIIHEEGIQKLTMDYLAKKYGITKGGVLYHFESKGSLLLKMNEMIIQEFEEKIENYKSKLSGLYLYTRAYALATLDYINDSENALLPAVFISSQEDRKSKKLWQMVSEKWDKEFDNDQGDPDKILELRLICDGIWFSIMYNFNYKLKDRIQELVERYCNLMQKEEL